MIPTLQPGSTLPVGPQLTLRWAVCADPRAAEADEVRALLAAEGITDARWFAPKDVEDLDEAVQQGMFDAVFFSDRRTLFDAIFDWKIRLDHWAARRVLIRTPGDTGSRYTTIQLPYSCELLSVFTAYGSWRAGQCKRRAIAALVLSAVALACALAIVWIATRLATH